MMRKNMPPSQVCLFKFSMPYSASILLLIPHVITGFLYKVCIVYLFVLKKGKKEKKRKY